MSRGGSRLLFVLLGLLRAGNALWKNGRMNTCNLRSFFPGSQPDSHQPICPEELSGDVNSLLNNFSGQIQTQKVLVWGWGRFVSLGHLMTWLQKANLKLVKASPSTDPWRLIPSYRLRHLPSGLHRCRWCLVLEVSCNQEADDIRNYIWTLECCTIHLFPRHYLLKRKKTPILDRGSTLIFTFILMAATESKTARTCETY